MATRRALPRLLGVALLYGAVQVPKRLFTSSPANRILRGTLFAAARRRYDRPMPELLSALMAFVAEHRRCGDLGGGLDDGIVRIECSCGAELVRPAKGTEPGPGSRPQTR
jgi:hypothetical protein